MNYELPKGVTANPLRCFRLVCLMMDALPYYVQVEAILDTAMPVHGRVPVDSSWYLKAAASDSDSDLIGLHVRSLFVSLGCVAISLSRG